MSKLGIYDYREKKGISQNEMAKLLGVTTRTIRNWEAGQAIPQSKRQMLDTLGISIETDKNEKRDGRIKRNVGIKMAIEEVYKTLGFPSWSMFTRITGVGNISNKRTMKEDGTFALCFTDEDCSKICQKLNVNYDFLKGRSTQMFKDDVKPNIKISQHKNDMQDKEHTHEIKTLSDQIKRLSEQIDRLNGIVMVLAEKIRLE